MKAVRQKIRALTSRKWNLVKDVRVLIEKLNPILRGWGNYFRTGNAAQAADIFAGDVLQAIVDQLANLNAQDLAQVSTFDFYNSYIDDVRVVSQERIDVDTCELWTTTLYQRSTSQPLQPSEVQLLPQTLTLEKLSNGWFITSVNFYDAPAFCQ